MSNETMAGWQRALLNLAARLIPATYRDEVMADLREQHARWSSLLVATLRSARDTRRHMKEPAMESSRMFGGVVGDLKGAWRQHRAHPGGALTIVAILAVAIGLNTALFSMVQGVLLQPLSFADAVRVVFVWTSNGTEQRAAMAPGRALDLRTRSTSFEAGALIGHISMTITGRGDAERWHGASVSSTFFDIVQTPAAVGRTFAAASAARNEVVLSHRLWIEKFHGDRQVVGRTIVMNGIPRVITGVMGADFYWPAITGETSAENPPLFWTCAPLPDVPERPVVFEGDVTKNRNTGFLRFVARLKQDVSADAARAELATIASALGSEYPETDGGRGFALVGAREQLFGSVERPLLFVLLASVLVVVAACVNVGNLLLVRLAGRRRELAVRSALGASRWRIARQLMAEAMVLTLAGGLVGLWLAAASLKGLIALTPPSVGRLDHITINGTVLAVSLAATIATGCVLGLVSALAAWRDRSADDMRGAGVAPASSGALRKVLVSVEVAVAVTLLVGATMFAQSLLRLQRVDVGFNATNLLTFDVMLTGERAEYQAKQLDFFNRFLERVRALPGVVNAAGAVTLPIGGDDFGASILIDGRPVPAPGDERHVGFQIVGSEWFRTLGMHLMRGRDFVNTDTRQSAGVVIINQALASLEWPGEDPVGRRLRMGRESDSDALTVIGVVSDIRHMGPASDARPEIYLTYSQMSLPMMAVAVRTAGDPIGLVPAIRAAAAEVDATQPLSGIHTMEEHLLKSYGRARFLAELTVLFGVLALGLAVIGVYGVTSFSAAQRTREFGVRTALGATPAMLMRTVMGENLTPILLGVAGGLAMAIAAAQLIATLLFDTAPTEISTYAIAATVLLLTALIATALPARRAGKVDPVRAIRELAN